MKDVRDGEGFGATGTPYSCSPSLVTLAARRARLCNCRTTSEDGAIPNLLAKSQVSTLNLVWPLAPRAREDAEASSRVEAYGVIL